MRILLTMTGSWGTGSGTVVEALAAGFAARGHAVCVLHPENREADGGAMAGDDASIASAAETVVWPFPVQEGDVVLPHFPLMITDPNPRAPDGAWTYGDMSGAERALFVRRFGERLRSTVEAFQPDVIECQHVWLMAWVAREMGLPYFAAAHHSDQMAFQRDVATAPYARLAALGAERIFALLEPGKRQIVELYGVAPDRVTVLGNGYDRQAFFPAEGHRQAVLDAHGLEVPSGAPLVTFAGKLSGTKGIDVLLEANGLLRARMADPPHFLVFGTGRLEAALDATKEASGAYVRDGFHLLGHQPYEALRDAHHVAKLSVMPSRSEGFGLAALEAMGCGLPVVCSNLGGLDTVTVGGTAEPGDAHSLADAIQRVLEQPPEAYRAMCADALAVAQTFSWDEIVERRLALYADLPPLPAPRPLPPHLGAAERRASADVAPLRTAVLRPTWTDRLATYPEDDAPSTIHMAVFRDGEVAAVATVYPEAPPADLPIPAAAQAPGAAFRLRGMASAPDVRGEGYGAEVLRGCLREIGRAGGTYLWCNARVAALAFYERMGLRAVGPEFDITGIGPHYVMWRSLGS